MSYDPFGNDPDADIFRDDTEEDEITQAAQSEDIEAGSPHKHTLDGTECPSCGIVHPTYITEDLPSEAVEAIQFFFDAMPVEFVAEVLESGLGKKAKPQAEMLTAFISYTERMDNNKPAGPILLAIVEQLDGLTGGLVSIKWRIYDAERKLVISHKVMKSANTALDDATTNDATPDFISLLHLIVDFAQQRLDTCKQRYLKAAAVINYEPIESVLEHGIYPDDEDRDIQRKIAEDLYKELVTK